MTLQASGAISINDIRNELQQSQGNNSLRSLSATAGFSTPDAISEFYGFSFATEFVISDIGFADGEQCCVDGPDQGLQIVYSASTALALNVSLYTDNTLQTQFEGNDKWWYSGGFSYFVNTSGKITDIINCG